MNGRDVLHELRAAVRGVRAWGGRRHRATPTTRTRGDRELVRTAIMDLTGYFQTESSHHASEYLPYFRRTPS